MGKKTHPTHKVGRKPKASDNSSPNRTVQSHVDRIKGLSVASIVDRVKSTDKNVLLAISLAGVLIIIGGIALLSGDSSNEVADESAQIEEIETATVLSASIQSVEGTLQTKDETGDWTDISEGFEVTEKSSIRTVGATSRAIVELENKTELRLDANSEVTIDTLSDERVVVLHLNGYTYNRVVPSGQAYVVKSTNAQYEALGTSFRTSATGDEQSVEVFHNSVIETTNNKRATEGRKYTAKSRVEPSKNDTFEDIDIEEIKNDKFIQWNIEKDLASDLFKDDLGFLSDTEGPALNITSHQSGDIILLEPSATAGTIEIAGNTERNTTVTITNTTAPDKPKVDTKSDENGAFVSPVLSSDLGDTTFELIARDRAGNETTATLRVTFQRKSAAVTVEMDGINLDIAIDEDEELLLAEWALTGTLKAPDGYKLVYGTKSNPKYPNDESIPVSSAKSTTIDTNEFSADTAYYFRVCIYDADENECGTYSNSVKKTPN